MLFVTSQRAGFKFPCFSAYFLKSAKGERSKGWTLLISEEIIDRLEVYIRRVENIGKVNCA